MAARRDARRGKDCRELIRFVEKLGRTRSTRYATLDHDFQPERRLIRFFEHDSNPGNELGVGP